MLSASLTIPPAAVLNSVAARTVSAVGGRTVMPVTFGTAIATGQVLNVLPAAVGSDRLLVQVLWGHGTIQSISAERLNDLALPATSTVTHFLGAQTSTHAPLVTAMAAQGITYTATLAGFAYSVIDLPVRSFTGQLQITASIQGLRLYDPRLDSTRAGGSGAHRLADPATWAWSDNPALADARWLADTVFGCGEPVDWLSVMTTASACDALIGAPSERRRVIGLTIDKPSRVADVAEAMRVYAGCWHVPSPGGIQLVPDTTGSSVATYSHDAGTLLRLAPLVARDTGGAPTVVEVLYTDTSKRPVREGSAIASLPGAGTTRPYRLSQVRLPGITRYSQALREATERLNKLTLGDLGSDVEVLDEGIRHTAGDLVTLTHPVGLTAKVFRVSGTPELVSRGRWRMPLVEYDPLMYSTLVATAPSVPDTSLINPAGPPPNVSGLTAAVIAGAVRLTWTPAGVTDYDTTELRRGASWAAGVRLDTGAAGSLDVSGTGYDWSWPAPGSYTILARHRDTSGNLSTATASLAITVTAAGISIGAGGISAQIGGGNILRNALFGVDSNADGVADFWAPYVSGSPGTVVRSISATGGPDNGRNMRLEALSLPPGGVAGWSTSSNVPIALPSAGGPVRMSGFVLHTNSVFTSYLEFKNAAGSIIGVAQQSFASPGATWQRRAIGGIAPAGTTQVFAYYWIEQGTNAYAALFLSQPQIEPGDIDTAFAPRADELLPGVVGTTELAGQAVTDIVTFFDAAGVAFSPGT